MSTMGRIAREARERYPEPGSTPVEHLRHALAVMGDDTTDEEWVIRATTGIYGDRVTTGITYGDLRALLALVDSMDNGPGDSLSTSAYRDAFDA